MIRKGFKMFLYPGMAEEYEKRHNALWPEMKEMIHEYQADGVVEIILQSCHTYNIEAHFIKRTVEAEGIPYEELWAKGADTAINRKWWDFMADIMETNEDNSPVCVDLSPVFHLD